VDPAEHRLPTRIAELFRPVFPELLCRSVHGCLHMRNTTSHCAEPTRRNSALHILHVHTSSLILLNTPSSSHSPCSAGTARKHSSFNSQRVHHLVSRFFDVVHLFFQVFIWEYLSHCRALTHSHALPVTAARSLAHSLTLTCHSLLLCSLVSAVTTTSFNLVTRSLAHSHALTPCRFAVW
jgi:hypothetical protein